VSVEPVALLLLFLLQILTPPLPPPPHHHTTPQHTMASRPFVFGSGAGADIPFTGRVEGRSLGAENAELKAKLALALDQNRLLAQQRDAALKAEGIAHNVVNALRATWSPIKTTMADSEDVDALRHENASLRHKQQEDSNAIEDVQAALWHSNTEVAAKNAAIEQLKKQLEAKERDHAEGNKAYEGLLKEVRGELTKAEEANDNLKSTANEHNAKVAHIEATLSRANEELKHAQEAYHAINAAKDEAEVEQYDLKLQLESLHAEWEEQQAKIKELEDRCDQVEALEAHLDSLQEDLERQNEVMGEHSRTLLVKDERIAHLEAQYQRERQRAMDAADASANATVAAATSQNGDDAPPPFSSLGDSLHDQLSNDYDEFEYLNDEEPLNYSSISSISVAPIEPVVASRTIEVNESASTAPVDVVIPKLTLAIHEPVSTAPVDIVTPKLSVSLGESVDTAPVDVSAPKLNLTINEAVSTIPVDIIAPKLSVSVNESAIVAPIDVVTPELSISVNESANVAPTDITAPKLSVGITESASIAPIDIASPKLGVSISDYFSVAPIDIPASRLSVSVNESASVAPIDIAAPKLGISIGEAVAVNPIDFAAPNLSIDINESASTAPIQRKVDVTTTSVQTDSQELFISMLPAGTLDYAPSEPIAVDTSSMSSQTEAPQLAAVVVHEASIDITPVEPIEPIEIGASATVAQTDARDLDFAIAPVQEIYEADPFEAAVPTALTNSSVLTITEQEPIEAMPRAITPETATTSSSAQTIEIPAPPVDMVIPPTGTLKGNTVSLLQSILTALFAILCIYYYAEVQNWRNANGVGNTYHRSGAYGNGRYLFGVIPLAMDEGSNVVTQHFARYVSIAIASFEAWAGISDVPHY
jgi:hypothetical protein